MIWPADSPRQMQDADGLLPDGASETDEQSVAGEQSGAARRSEGSNLPSGIILKLGRFLWKLPSQLLIRFTRLYQIAISPLIGPTCRFRPTCSEYFLQSVQKHGALRGSWRGALRILRCHPWNPGGYDPP